MTGAAERDSAKLHELLSGLHAQLLATRSVKPEDYTLLRKLAEDIQVAPRPRGDPGFGCAPAGPAA